MWMPQAGTRTRWSYRETDVSNAQKAYIEALVAGAGLAALTAGYQALATSGSTVAWQAVGAAALLGALGYLQVALRWLSVPPEVPK